MTGGAERGVVLSGGARGVLTSIAGTDLSSTNWTTVYHDTTYQAGIRRGRAKFRKAGVAVPVHLHYGGS